MLWYWEHTFLTKRPSTSTQYLSLLCRCSLAEPCTTRGYSDRIRLAVVINMSRNNQGRSLSSGHTTSGDGQPQTSSSTDGSAVAQAKKSAGIDAATAKRSRARRLRLSCAICRSKKVRGKNMKKTSRSLCMYPTDVGCLLSHNSCRVTANGPAKDVSELAGPNNAHLKQAGLFPT